MATCDAGFAEASPNFILYLYDGPVWHALVREQPARTRACGRCLGCLAVWVSNDKHWGRMLAAVKSVSSKDAQRALEQDRKAKKREKKQRKKARTV